MKFVRTGHMPLAISIINVVAMPLSYILSKVAWVCRLFSFPASFHHVTFMIFLQIEIQKRYNKIHNRNTMYYNQVENYSSNEKAKYSILLVSHSGIIVCKKTAHRNTRVLVFMLKFVFFFCCILQE